MWELVVNLYYSLHFGEILTRSNHDLSVHDTEKKQVKLSLWDVGCLRFPTNWLRLDFANSPVSEAKIDVVEELIYHGFY